MPAPEHEKDKPRLQAVWTGVQPRASHYMGLLLPPTWDGLILLVGSMMVPTGAFGGGHQASPWWIPGKEMGIGSVGTSLSHSVVS